MKSNKLLLGIGYGILIILYNIIVFIFAKDMNAVFWWSYVFTMFAFAIQLIVFVSLIKLKTNLKDIFFGIPLFQISIIYLIIQITVGGLFMILMESMPLKFSNLFQIIILAVFLILSIPAIIAKNIVIDSDEKTDEKVLFIKLLENDINDLNARVTDLALKAHLNDISEQIRYSDPMSHQSLALVEQKISNLITQLCQNVQESKFDGTKLLCDEVEILIAERNRKCKILK